MMNFIQKFPIISLLKQYKRTLAWFISGLVMAVLLFLGTSNQHPATAQQPATVSNQTYATASTQIDVSPTYSDFAATHLEPNFYQ